MKALREYKWLIVIFFLALLVRFILIYLNPRNSVGEDPFIFDLARNMLAGKGYGFSYNEVSTVSAYSLYWPNSGNFAPYTALPLGLSALIAGLYLVFGITSHIFTQIRVLQVIIDSFACIFIFLIGKELLNKKVGYISAFIYSIFLPIAYIATCPIHDALMPFFITVSLYYFILGVKRDSIKYYIVSAIVIGISCYFQPTTIVLPLMLGLGVFIYSIYKTSLIKNILNSLKVTAIMMIVLVLIISPWMIRNYNISGYITPMRPSSWLGIYEGFAEFGTNPANAELCEITMLEQASKDVGHNIIYTSKECDDYFKNKVISTIKNNPVWYLGLLAKRLPHAIVFTSDIGIEYIPRDSQGISLIDPQGGTRVSEYYQQHPTVTELVKKVSNGTFIEFTKKYPYSVFTDVIIVLYGILPIILSILGIYVYRKYWRKLVLLLTIPLYFILVSMPIVVGAAKHKLPGQVGYIMLSGLAIYWLYCKIRKHKFT